MRKLFIALSIIFLILSIIFVILPMGSLALLPTGLTVIFAFLSNYKSTAKSKKITQVILILSILLLLIASGKLLIKDKVKEDAQFNQEQIQSQKDAIGELEDLENSDSLSVDTTGQQ